MKNLTLIKHHSNVQLAHIYEHLFCRRVNELFFEHGLYKSLDYFLRGVVYRESGLIIIDIDFYTSEAEDLIKEISGLSIVFEREDINTAIIQIIAEKLSPIRYSNFDTLTAELHKLNATQWTDIDEFELLDEKNIRKQIWPIHLLNRHVDSKTLVFEMRLNDEFAQKNRELIPLFWKLSNTIGLTVSDRLAARWGLYVNEAQYDNKTQAHKLKLTASPYGQPIEINDCIKDVLDTAHFIVQTKTLQRFTRELNQISYREQYDKAPSYEPMLDETFILIGSNGWKKIATEENVSKILRYISFRLKLGRKTLEQKF